MAPNVPNASAENKVLSVVSYVTMTSGQCTMGAMIKVNVCLPVQNVSFSFTITALESISKL